MRHCATYRRDNDAWVPIVHFCTDLKHREQFESELRAHPTEDSAIIPLFGGAVTDYAIAAVIMHTKIPRKGRPWTPVTLGPGEPEFDNEEQEAEFNYVRRCAELFFGTRWNEVGTKFEQSFNQAVVLAIKKCADFQSYTETPASSNPSKATWPQMTSAVPTYHTVPHPNAKPEKWHNRISKVLGRTISALSYGHTVTTDQQTLVAESREGFHESLPQPTIVMYRSFDRDLSEPSTAPNAGARYIDEQG